MRRVAAIGIVMAVSWLAPATSQAQSQAVQRAAPTLAIDRWMTEPVEIKLTDSQRRSFDSLRVEFKKEDDKARTEAKSTSPKEAVAVMSSLYSRYQRLVRRLLTPDQQKDFNANTGTVGGGG
jgi:hypothetical protein